MNATYQTLSDVTKRLETLFPGYYVLFQAVYGQGPRILSDDGFFLPPPPVPPMTRRRSRPIVHPHLSFVFSRKGFRLSGIKKKSGLRRKRGVVWWG